jgi:carbonic anhydrase
MIAHSFADAVVTRGAAGRMASQFSNLLFLDHVLNFTDVMIIHHTGGYLLIHVFASMLVALIDIHHLDCSAQLFPNEGVCQVLAERSPDASREVEDLKLPGFKEYVRCTVSSLLLFTDQLTLASSLERSVQEDVQLVKRSPLVRKELAERTRGFVYDLKTGEVKPVPESKLVVAE